jgi:uncharacterized membrane protein
MGKFYIADWVIGIVGGLLSGSLMLAAGIKITDTPWLWVFYTVLAVFVLIGILRIKTKRDFLQRNAVDERLIAITDKSARNGLIATYLILFGITFYTSAQDEPFVLNAQLMLVAIAFSLLVFYVSYYFYYYRRS